MVHGADRAYNLTTYHGPANLRAMPTDNIRTNILELCHQDGPITLNELEFNLTDASIDNEVVRIQIEKNILKLGTKHIFCGVFQELCAGYSEQPHATIKHIRQVYVGADGSAQKMSVYKF